MIFPNFKLKDFLRQHSTDYQEHDAGTHMEYAICCPECEKRGKSKDTEHKCWINPKKGMFLCYRCGWSGSLVTFVRGMLNCDYKSATKVLMGNPLDKIDFMNMKLFDEEIDWRDSEIDVVSVDLPYGYIPIESEHDYLTERGVPWEYAEANDWGYAEIGFCANRIIVPFYMENQMVFWQARWIGELPEGEQKVLNPKGCSARHVLFNYDSAKEFEEIVLVEGFIDAVKCGENAMALNGKTLHPQQLLWLEKTKAKEIVLFLDADAWEVDKHSKKNKKSPAQMAIDLLRIKFKVRVAMLPKGQDPGMFAYKDPQLLKIIADSKAY